VKGSTVSRAPATRVSAARDLIDFVEKFEPGAREKVLARFPRESREAFESTPRSSWLAIEHDHWVVDSVIAVLGRERALECWRDSVPDIIDKPLLRTFVSGMVRMFGRDPARIIGLFPKAWPLIYRDLSTLRLDTNAAGNPVLLFEDIAPEVREYPNYFVSWEGVCWGFSHIARVNGQVRAELSRDKSVLAVHFAWD
jgi:hypothetical protein